jgi:hypothetical protein
MTDDNPGSAAPEASRLEERIERIEDAVGSILERLKGGSGEAHKDAAEVTRERLGASSTVADEVEAELARRDAAAKQAERDERLGKLGETVAKLTEKTPQPPPRRVERVMGWHG